VVANWSPTANSCPASNWRKNMVSGHRFNISQGFLFARVLDPAAVGGCSERHQTSQGLRDAAMGHYHGVGVD
jgi:hypothetical protein